MLLYVLFKKYCHSVLIQENELYFHLKFLNSNFRFENRHPVAIFPIKTKINMLGYILHKIKTYFVGFLSLPYLDQFIKCKTGNQQNR